LCAFRKFAVGDAGMMWGWRRSSSQAPFESSIPDNDREWQKAAVLKMVGFNAFGCQNILAALRSPPTAWRETMHGAGV